MRASSFIGTVVLFIALIASLFIAPNLTAPYAGFNIFIPTLTITFLLGEYRLAFAAAIIGGFFFDLIAATPFGTYLMAFTIGLAAIRWIARTRITNRSIPAYLALVAIGRFTIDLGILTLGSLAKFLPSQTLSPNLQWSSLVAIAIDLLQDFILSAIVLVILRFARGSYAKLMHQEF